MPLEEVIAGVTFTGFTTVPPATPGLVAMSIFGTTKDGKNGNRVPGSPTQVNTGGGAGPTIGTNFITVNNGTSQTSPLGFDTAIAETTAGWTMFAVARYTPTSGNATCLGIGTTGTVSLVLNPANTNVSSHASAYLSAFGVTFTGADATLDFGAGVSGAAWRMFSCSMPGPTSSAQFFTLRDVTGNTSKTTTTTATRTPTAAYHFTYGHSGGNGGAAAYAQCDLAAGGFATGALAMSDLQTLRTWLLGVLSVRGVTGF